MPERPFVMRPWECDCGRTTGHDYTTSTLFVCRSTMAVWTYTSSGNAGEGQDHHHVIPWGPFDAPEEILSHAYEHLSTAFPSGYTL